MKNIHVLPTDKLSIIGFDSVKNLHFTNDFIDDYQNIYITSDEEIKDRNCWVTNGEDVFKPLDDYSLEYANRYWKKIILTTDIDLIKDGVQSIDDEFLQWFVKNPSCEKVEIVGDNCYYEIIIPKEEPKCEHPTRLREYYHENAFKCFECNKIIIGTDIINLEQTKTPKTNLERLPFPELLKEFAEYYNDIPIVERMYSEEEVFDLLDNLRLDSYNYGMGRIELLEWFEKFKKK